MFHEIDLNHLELFQQSITPRLGAQIKVKWDCRWYDGIVIGYDPIKKLHIVSYNDGDQFSEDLSKELWAYEGSVVPEIRQKGAKKASKKASKKLKVLTARDLIGTTIENEKQFNVGKFTGIVSSHNPMNGNYRVKYTDGDVPHHLHMLVSTD